MQYAVLPISPSWQFYCFLYKLSGFYEDKLVRIALTHSFIERPPSLRILTSAISVDYDQEFRRGGGGCTDRHDIISTVDLTCGTFLFDNSFFVIILIMYCVLEAILLMPR